MDLRQSLFVFFAAMVATGCISEQETIREPFIVDRTVYVDRPVPTPAEDGWRGLEVVPGNLSDVVVMNGQDRELIRLTVVNHGERDVEVRQLPVGLGYDNGLPIEFPFAFTDVKFENNGGATLMGPLDYNFSVGANLYFTDAVVIPAGESQTFVLRADVALTYGQYRVTVGALVGLLEDVVYADSGERVPADQIRNNQLIGRMFESLYLPPPTTEPDGPVALIATFSGDAILLTPSLSPYYIGRVSMTAYGGGANGGIVRFEGENLGAFEELELMEDADVVASSSIAGGVQADLNFEAVRFEEGELRTFELRGRLRPADELGPFYARDIEVRLSHVSFIPDEGEGTDGFIRTFSDPALDPALRVFRAFPIITPLTVPTETLANGSLDLYKFQAVAAPSGTIVLGGATFGLSGGSGSSRVALSQFRVRRGSSELPRDSYRVVDMGDGSDVENGTLVWNAFGSTTVAVLFDTIPFEVGAGDVVTLVADVANVEPGQTLWVSFGPRDFEGSQGLLNAEGYILWNDEAHTYRSQDRIYWSDDSSPSSYFTGSWMIGNLDVINRFSR